LTLAAGKVAAEPNSSKNGACQADGDGRRRCGA
jgi:hypothetical protein